MYLLETKREEGGERVLSGLCLNVTNALFGSLVIANQLVWVD